MPCGPVKVAPVHLARKALGGRRVAPVKVLSATAVRIAAGSRNIVATAGSTASYHDPSSCYRSILRRIQGYLDCILLMTSLFLDVHAHEQKQEFPNHILLSADLPNLEFWETSIQSGLLLTNSTSILWFAFASHPGSVSGVIRICFKASWFAFVGRADVKFDRVFK